MAQSDGSARAPQPFKGGRINGWPRGLNNLAPDTNIPSDQLRDAINVDIQITGEPRLRPGMAQAIASADAHSLFATKDNMYWATSTQLYKANASLQTTLIDTNKAYAKPISYAYVNDIVYFANENTTGKIVSSSVLPWGDPAGIYGYKYLDANGDESFGVNLFPPPPGQLIAHSNGQIWIASGSTLYHTEPSYYDYVDYTSAFFVFPERITLLHATRYGVYIGSDKIFFLPNAGTADVTKNPLLPARAVEGAVTTLPDSQDVVFMTDRGFVRATQEGQIAATTEDTLAVDRYERGAMGYVNFNGHKSVVAAMKNTTALNPYVAKEFR